MTCRRDVSTSQRRNRLREETACSHSPGATGEEEPLQEDSRMEGDLNSFSGKWQLTRADARAIYGTASVSISVADA